MVKDYFYSQRSDTEVLHPLHGQLSLLDTQRIGMHETQQPTVQDLQKAFIFHLEHTLVKDRFSATKADM